MFDSLAVEGFMRYHKSLHIVATFVASAGAFVVLHGTARADSATTAPAQQATLAPDGSAVSAPVSNPSGAQNEAGKGNSQQASHPHNSAASPVDSSNSSKVQPNDSSTAPLAGDGKPQDATNNPPAATTTDNNSLPVTVTSPVAATNPSADESVQQAPVITLAGPSQPPSSMLPAIILPIQPTIRSYAVADTGDLAWSLPSVPVADRQPVPAKTNGALGNLRLILENVVVPTTYALTDWVGLAGLMVALGTMGGLLLGSLYSFSYGLWLKRGGFVNAARSDAPMALDTSSLFATPQLLGYVTMPPRRHSPIFVVADIKFLIYEFLFPTLSERRTCI